MEYTFVQESAAATTQTPISLARNEIEQAAESGREVADLREELTRVDADHDAALIALYEAALARPEPPDWPHFEGSRLADILAELAPAGPSQRPDRLDDRVRGAWAGRVVGNMMGKPFEGGARRLGVKEYLLSYDAYPLTGYVPYADGGATSVFGSWGFDGVTEGRIDGSIRDDDVDYTVLGLHILENYGDGYTSRDVATEWLYRFPVYQVYTAERATYQNLVREIPFERVGEFRNPYREWIGALIRADIFGYVAPGNPRRAAMLAYADAALSHRANGIYGEMWAAALVASAFTATSAKASVVESLQHIPPTSRLATEITAVLADFERGASWEEAMEALERRYPTMSWVHTINNAGALAAALLWGDGDFGATTGLAVQAALDTDSIGATAGSWAGAFLGYDAIPAALVEPLRGRISSAVFGFGESGIDDLAARTLRLAGRRR
ncbi:ADP-ribosylglycohydrolase family protein [Fodinicola acaciae]|uniref:ADP-ribosylglycohydrolase family protein n=1 Tax=Fodinicola acaciae TaxID=2681555 RepID=UPI0013D3B1D0|nr:ADP-ribosylglycohydrolase family protein [Fodinicola acaciae]